MSVSPVCRSALDAEHPILVRIWRRAVEATHDFLTGDDIDGLEVQVRDVILPALGLTVATLRDEPVGWIGMHGSHVEALFVDPSAHRRGVGRALLSAAAAFPVVTVDVNEQNPSAIAFYETLGFVRTGRSALDGDGRPFPLVHLRRT